MIKIVVEGHVFEIDGFLTTSLASEKLQKTEDGSYKLPDEWNACAAQFSTLIDLLRSSR